MQKRLTTKKLTLLLIAILLLQVSFFTFYKINSLTETEQLMTAIYRQQLETILFSINQYAWDSINDWAKTLDNTVPDFTNDRANFEKRTQEFMENNSSGRAVFILQELEIKAIIPSNKSKTEFTQETKQLLSMTVERDANALRRLKRWQNVGYRKIHTVILGDSSKGQPDELVLIYAPEIEQADDLLIGIVVNMREFVQTVLGARLNQFAGQQFAVAVFEGNLMEPIYSTSSFTLNEGIESTKLWVLPHYILAIKSTEDTIEDLAWERRFSDLAVTIILNICLVIGIWLLYRNINRESQLAHMKSDFVSNVSHELRTPLSMIRMFAETLEMKRVKTEEKKQEYYGIIRQESERMTHLVNNILNFSKMEAGQIQMPLQKEDLNNLVKKVVDNYRFHLTSHGFIVKEAFAESLPTIKANEEAISEAVINLLENAVKYSEQNKEVAIITGSENGNVFVEIKDKGIGIPPNKQKAIFDKFYRVSNGLVHNTRGSGLGLTLVKHIMLEHQGDVDVNSLPGEGSTFRLRFPINPEAK